MENKWMPNLNTFCQNLNGFFTFFTKIYALLDHNPLKLIPVHSDVGTGDVLTKNFCEFAFVSLTLKKHLVAI